MSDTPPQRVGPYQIETRLGEGGMGTGYRALDARLNRLVAIKFLASDRADVAALRRFQREAQMASSLNHPHILMSTSPVSSRADRISSSNLSRVERCATGRGPADVPDATSWNCSPASPTRSCRDTTRAFCIATSSQRTSWSRKTDAKLADFGLAKLADELHSTRTLADAATRPGVVIGTIA